MMPEPGHAVQCLKPVISRHFGDMRVITGLLSVTVVCFECHIVSVVILVFYPSRSDPLVVFRLEILIADLSQAFVGGLLGIFE